jgi:Spy/CpxP family protein refolding chaperone
MSLKQKFFSGLTLAFAFVAFSTFASAQDSSTNQDQNSTQKQERRERRGFGNRGGFGKEGKRGGHRGDKMMMHGLSRLNLTDSQKEQTRTLFENFKTSTQPQREEMRGLMEKRRDGVITADETARLKELRTQMRASGEQLHTSVLAILTPEQRTQLDTMKQEMKERRRNRQNQQMPNTKNDY